MWPVVPVVVIEAPVLGAGNAPTAPVAPPMNPVMEPMNPLSGPQNFAKIRSPIISMTISGRASATCSRVERRGRATLKRFAGSYGEALIT